MSTKSINYKNLYYPPGGILMWIIIFLELLTFGMALVALVYYAKQDPDTFHQSQLLLNKTYGAINTLVLITSGFFMAKTVSFIETKDFNKAKHYLRFTMFGGLLFIGIKSIEYVGKIEAGLGIGYDTFFSFYWLLTLFHLVHVIVGLIILVSVYRTLAKQPQNLNIEDVEASAAFWHMCDLIWLLLFPILYLLL